jgi:hypothetical protein
VKYLKHKEHRICNYYTTKPVDLYRCQYDVLRILYGHKGEKSTGGKVKFHDEKLIICYILLSTRTGWTIVVLGFDSRRELGIFLFTTASRTALGHTQPPIQWVIRALSVG